MAVMLLSSSVGELLDLGEPYFDRRELLLAERHLRAARLELLEHVLGAHELIFGRLDLARRVALTSLDAIELAEQFVLDLRRPHELLAEHLHLPRALGDFGRDRLAGRDELDVALFLLDDRRLVELRAVEALLRGGDGRLQLVELGDERHERRLQRAHGVELVLRVDHLRGQAVARRLERFELGRAAPAAPRAF